MDNSRSGCVLTVAALTFAWATTAHADKLDVEIARYTKYFNKSADALRSGGVQPHAKIKTWGFGAYAGVGGLRTSFGRATVFHNGMAYRYRVLDVSALGGLMLGGGIEGTETIVAGQRGMKPEELLPKTYDNRRTNVFFAGEGLTDASNSTRTWSANLGPSVAGGWAIEGHRLIKLGSRLPIKTALLSHIEEGQGLAARASAALGAGNTVEAKNLVAQMEHLRGKVNWERMTHKRERETVGGH